MKKPKTINMKYKIVRGLVMATTLCIAWTSAGAVNVPSWESGKSDEHCKSEWTTRGVLDQRMFNYCMRREREAYDSFVALASEYSNQPWIQEAIDHSLAACSS